jgi:hypothetical protein
MLNKEHMTIRAVLDRITQLDSAYKWENDGTEKAPFIVISPRTGSVLNWTVPRICGTARERSAKALFGRRGNLTTLFGRYGVALSGFMAYERASETTTPQGSDDRNTELPDVPLDTCRDDLTARDVLNQAIKLRGRVSRGRFPESKGFDF